MTFIKREFQWTVANEEESQVAKAHAWCRVWGRVEHNYIEFVGGARYRLHLDLSHDQAV